MTIATIKRNCNGDYTITVSNSFFSEKYHCKKVYEQFHENNSQKILELFDEQSKKLLLGLKEVYWVFGF